MANLAARLADFDEAKSQYRTILAREPGYLPAHLLLCDLLIQRGEYDEAKFFATPLYLCNHVLDRWATLAEAEWMQLTSVYMGKDRQRSKTFLSVKSAPHSPLDVAYALKNKRKFDAGQAFAPVKGKRKAPMDQLR